MKKIKGLVIAAFLTIILWGLPNALFAENNMDVSFGAGIPKFINIGLRYNAAQMQVGLSYGFLPLENEICTSLTGDIFLHFAGHSALTTRKPWYAKFGISYVRDKQEDNTSSYVYSNFRIGREFFISKKFGVGADLGISFELSKEIEDEQAASGWFNLDLDFPVLPCFGINIFYHFGFLPRNNRGGA